MPFRQLDGEPLATHLTDGLVADIVCQLAGLRELSVISHGTTLGMREPDLDPRAIGRQLNVRYVVRGALRRSGNTLRVTTELADAGSGMVVWARSHDTSGNPSFADQDRIVGQIVNTLSPRVREIELRRIRGKRPESLTIYEKILLSRERLSQVEQHSFAQAKLLLDGIVAAEPSYAEAHALLAEWHTLSMGQGWLVGRDEIVKRIDQLTQTALQLDRDNVRALVACAHRQSMLHRDYADALRLFGHALDISPSATEAWLFSSYTCSYRGDADEAVRRAQRAIELSPRDRKAHDFYSALAVAHYTAGDHASATAWGRKALAEPTPKTASYRWTAAALVAQGKHAEAAELAAACMRIQPGFRVRYMESSSPIQDRARRETYIAQLLAAGFPQ